MEKNNDFAVFILTHGRPDKVITYQTLKKMNYNGNLYFIVDNEDKTIDKYIENFGKENVIMFDKKQMADKIDEANNFDNRKVIVHARNACFDIAKSLGIKYFIQLDDDYTDFRYKLIIDDKICNKPIKNINNTFEYLLEYYKNTKALSIAFAQEGDFIGGIDNGNGIYRFSKRKCMNSFICSTDRYFNFIGSINEDVNTYTTLGSRGELFLTIPFVALTQKQTQSQGGGMTDVYKLSGTYVKSFITVMMQPSSVGVSMMRSSNPRLHHSINWKITAPVIIDDCNKKI